MLKTDLALCYETSRNYVPRKEQEHITNIKWRNKPTRVSYAVQTQHTKGALHKKTGEFDSE